MTQFRIFGTRSRWLWRFLAAICIAVPTELPAASVTVTGDDPRQTIRVTIEDATMDYVVADLRKKYGFDVSGLSNDNRGEPQTMTISGSLQSVLERLLRNWNHMIVRSPDNTSGIAKVMILNSVYGAAPSSLVQNPTGSGDTTQLQALGGGQ